VKETNVLSVHIIGAVMAFGVGMVYIWMHGVMSYWTRMTTPPLNGLTVFVIRIACCVITTAAFVVSILCCQTFAGDGNVKGPFQWHRDFTAVMPITVFYYMSARQCNAMFSC
jgi:hypothetical protein